MSPVAHLALLTIREDGNRDTIPLRKPENKSTRHGWLSRKLLPRHSTTFTYKARTTYRPVARKKSFSRPLSSSDNQRNIFEDKSLEETCRLGGQGVLALPEEYAAGKLTLPTCLSATATYLLHHGKHIMLNLRSILIVS